ncbi:hypothetical protein G3I59_40150 [Amycolatopsis rubida]|uniref:SPOR domain-containing protein n=1 Tax=Amycolatopsis rubida TaxID=112413 RepID=A0A1I5RWJ7_9PSEU|nr:MULTISPECIES: hypothetical protein [Amycolatopsis]MYW96662.1 hypothetical protein [Amycolatopsis rubida]NEC61646.1 hypothetical protein [Amycolatopsis rubida]OAP21398.1 hypothetical protein A4R44_07916 [Amycolatopsis sp. M39]SFP62908.1 hypothetical protein SAMN05421854_10698 [Amycolatopsis rubida]
MSEEWYCNTRTNEVERGRRARGVDRLGPYPDEAAAQRALELAGERTKAEDQADAEWDNPQ